jgi:hypothetical protein
VGIGVGIGRVRGVEGGDGDRLQLHLDPRSGRRLLDDGLHFLRQGIDAGGEHHLETLAVARPHSVGSPLPSARVEELIGLVDAELPPDVLRAESLGGVEKVPGGLSEAAENLLLDGGAIDEDGERPPHERIGEEGMHRLDARPLAVDVGPRIGLVQLDVSDSPSETDGHPPLAALLEALQHVVLDPPTSDA